MPKLSDGTAKFKQGDTVKTPKGDGQVHRVVSTNPDSTCRDCGSKNVKVGERDFSYWVQFAEGEPAKFKEADLA